MKVAYVLPSLRKPSGWHTHSTALIQAIDNFVEPVLYVSRDDARSVKFLFPQKKAHILPTTQGFSLSSWRGLLKLSACFKEIKRSHFPRVDLVHSLEAYPTGLAGNWLARKFRCPHILTSHGTYGVVWYKKTIDRFAYQQVLKNTALVCPVSNGTAGLMQQYFQHALGQTRVQVIPNGNDFFKKITKEDLRNRKPPTVPTLLTVADVKPRKGQHTSLAAFAKVKESLPDARYLIVGKITQNDYFTRLKEFIKQHHLKDVKFLNVVSDKDLSRYYQETSVFVMTPQMDDLNFEGFGLVYLEAGAYGVPVVATRCGGVSDAVKHEETGLLADPDDVDTIADAILTLLNNPTLARKMGDANREWSENLTWTKNAERHIKEYRSILREQYQ